MSEVKYKRKRCPMCLGKGYIKGTKCATCGGSGEVYEKWEYIETPHQKKIFIIPKDKK